MKKMMFSCAVFLFCFSVMAQNSVNLVMNPEKNKVYRFKSVSEQTVSQTVNGNQQTTDSKTNYSVSLKIIESTADFMIVEVRFDTLLTNTNTMGKTTNISSLSESDIKSSEAAVVMSYFMNRLSKNAVFAKMDYTGKVLDIVNSKMLSDIIVKDTSSITLPGQIASAVKSQVKNLVSYNSLKTLSEMYTHCLPGKQVSTGDNWNVTNEMNSGGMMLEITTTYHLDGINSNSANITAESTIKASEKAVPIESGSAKVVYDDLKGLSKSSLVIDIRTGLIIEDKGKTHIAGNLGISGPGFSMQMPMEINGETKVIQLQ